MINKVWKDPVWSKVISVGILAILSLIWAKINSIYSDKNFKDSISEIFNFKISVFYILLLFIGYWIFKWFIKSLNKSKPNIYEINKQKLRTVNKITDSKANIMMKWTVHFNSYGKPFISDVDCFCLKHGEPPIKYIYECCPINGCENSYKKVDEIAIHNYAESLVLNEWEKINNQK